MYSESFLLRKDIMDSIPPYPKFSLFSLDAAHSVQKKYPLPPAGGISDFTFGSLFFFNDIYHYKVSALNDHTVVFLSENGNKPFFFIPSGTASLSTITALLDRYGCWKFISEDFIKNNTELFNRLGCMPEEDRNNFDYVYTRDSLVQLSGKKLHSKKNHVNAFAKRYPSFEVKPLNEETRYDAQAVLDIWASRQDGTAENDYHAAQKALQYTEQFGFTGVVLYAENTPVAWCFGELIEENSIAVVHFEKALTEFRGSFQYINYAFARSLPESVLYINREQDLGDEGLRNAKMSYHPASFVKKYRLTKGRLSV